MSDHLRRDVLDFEGTHVKCGGLEQVLNSSILESLGTLPNGGRRTVFEFVPHTLEVSLSGSQPKAGR